MLPTLFFNVVIEEVAYLLWLAVVIVVAALVAKGFEAFFDIYILLLSLCIVGVGEEMLDNRVVAVIIGVYICNDVKAELT